MTELHLDRLLGRQVLAGNNRPVGRIEEFRAEKQDGQWVITEYLIGVGGLFERLGTGIKLLLGTQAGGGYVARWNQLDISDPERPRLTVSANELTEMQ